MKVTLLSGRLTKATKQAACFDIYSTETVVVYPEKPAVIPTGVRTKMGGCWGLICDRSGLASQGLSTRGGVIDPDYDKEWRVILVNDGNCAKTVLAGERIAQVLFVPLWQIEVVGEGVEQLDTVRTGGLGSTGQ